MKGEFRVGAAPIEWEVSFRCPGCEEAIFPEDASGKYCNLLGVKIEEGRIKEAVMKCAKCASVIHLESFDMLNKLGSTHELGDVEGRSIDVATEASELPPLPKTTQTP